MKDLDVFTGFNIDMSASKDEGEYILSAETRDNLLRRGEQWLWLVRPRGGRPQSTQPQERESPAVRAARVEKLREFYGNPANEGQSPFGEELHVSNEFLEILIVFAENANRQHVDFQISSDE